jgi:hypothetical protein
MSDLEQTRKKQEELGNHPRDTLMNIWDEDESYAISYRWFTGKAHKEWLEKTREKRLKSRQESADKKE